MDGDSASEHAHVEVQTQAADVNNLAKAAQQSSQPALSAPKNEDLHTNGDVTSSNSNVVKDAAHYGADVGGLELRNQSPVMKRWDTEYPVQIVI